MILQIKHPQNEEGNQYIRRWCANKPIVALCIVKARDECAEAADPSLTLPLLVTTSPAVTADGLLGLIYPQSVSPSHLYGILHCQNSASATGCYYIILIHPGP
ncbi:hypothetical protein COCSUDRAFT_33141 [Coccomyxa subellipsoidea C-169]|uniref:Uncharacterized protein n=1 Tax=Coccomyxa subellipsoidea (strain C-169) TaxID=574566 RepID=I0YYZ8_COCSC|nr:hypothetical protein COCSUDRAFT_33141 [Coccomyxa subellipsoidea C-169]EIE23617.1 hypothetical protein COCSUDRAFT_33141 [Coccomyxa subellipsoidea C-169]|eukprot:XP_005648161.1 hypothetical protein COCSUDRAFT_33141 [Coccomyxa subellipsoidea C-169]